MCSNPMFCAVMREVYMLQVSEVFFSHLLAIQLQVFSDLEPQFSTWHDLIQQCQSRSTVADKLQIFFTVKGSRYTTNSDYKKYTGQLSNRAVFSISSAMAFCFLNDYKIYYVSLLCCSWNGTDPSNTTSTNFTKISYLNHSATTCISD